MHTLAAPDDFVVVMKEMNPTGLWDAKLTWYSLSTTPLIYLCGFEHSLGIHIFRPT